MPADSLVFLNPGTMPPPGARLTYGLLFELEIVAIVLT
jgi:hypothetical protein